MVMNSRLINKGNPTTIIAFVLYIIFLVDLFILQEVHLHTIIPVVSAFVTTSTNNNHHTKITRGQTRSYPNNPYSKVALNGLATSFLATQKSHRVVRRIDTQSKYNNNIMMMTSTNTNNNENENQLSTTENHVGFYNNALIQTIGTTTSSVVSITFFTTLAYQRNAFMLTFFIGSILNAIVGKILKRIINQDRPDEGELQPVQDNDDDKKIKPNDKGMPSSHGMSLGFIITYTCMTIWNEVGGGLYGMAYCLSLWIYVLLSLIYRVNARLHTSDQIYVGLFFGIINGIFWRSLAFGSNPIFPNIHLMEYASKYILPSNGIMPTYYLIFPALVGVMVVGSFERRISRWMKKYKQI